MILPDKRETLKSAPKQGPPEPLTLDVREDESGKEYGNEEVEDEDDENTRGAFMMDTQVGSPHSSIYFIFLITLCKIRTWFIARALTSAAITFVK